MEYGRKIYSLRKQRALSQEEVANQLGVSRQSVSLWETDQASPSMDNLIAVAKLFNVSIDQIVGIKSLDKSDDKIKTKPIFSTGYKEDKHVVYRRDYKYLNSRADAIVFSLSLFFFIFALASFISALRMEIQVAKVILIIGNVSLIIGLIIYPLHIYINIMKKLENHNDIQIKFYKNFIIYNSTNSTEKLIPYEMLDYYIEKKDFLLLYLFKGKRIYIPNNNKNDLDKFLSERAERRKNKKPFWV